jgi:chemotaxis protein methyltransferase CheR
MTAWGCGSVPRFFSAMNVMHMSMSSPASSPANEFPFTPADFKMIAGLVYEHSGIVLGDHKRDMVYSRLARRLRALRLRSFREYCALLHGSAGEEEISSLINAITTNLTKFFREAHHFEHLRTAVLAQIWRTTIGVKPRVRIWSAACSTGEEPYSIAMSAVASRREAGREWDCRVLATDLDTAVLNKAMMGAYPGTALEDVPAGMRESAFTLTPSGVSVAKEIRALVTFKQLNLLGVWPMKGPFDAIFCRNVMIYFDAETKATLVERLHAILKPGGWLYVGHSESLLDQQHRFKLSGHTIYQKTGS